MRDLALRCCQFANTWHTASKGLLPSLFLFLLLVTAARAHSAEIIIILDDMGNKQAEQQAFQLPTEVVFAILPHTPYSKKFARLAEQQNRDVMLHMPMEALSGLYMGPGGISSDMDRNQILSTLEAAHNSVPNAIGLNNHMGSKLTQLSYPMQATMEYLRAEQMFFLDSRTTKFSRARNIAQELGVPNLRRHVFLDHVKKPKNIEFEFNRLKHRAKRNGFAIGIGHPHQATLAFLQEALIDLQDSGVNLVSVTDSLQPEQQHWVWNPASQLSR